MIKANLNLRVSLKNYFQKSILQKSLFSNTRFYSTNENAKRPEPKVTSYTNKKVSYATTTCDGFNLMSDTIPDLIEKWAEKTPSNLCYAFPHNRGLKLTFLELKQRVDTLAQSLLQLGFKKGERMALILPNTYEIILTKLACASIGVISVSLNPGYQSFELEYMLKNTGAKGVLIYDSFKTLHHYDIIKKLCPELDNCNPGELQAANLPDLRHVIILNSPLLQEKKKYKGTWTFEQLENGKIGNQKQTLPIIEADENFLILFTSGTTGKPKGVPIRQLGIMNCVNYIDCILNQGIPEPICSPIPLFHLFGLALGGLRPFISGNASIIPFFLPDTLTSMKAIEAFKCTWYCGPPTIYIDLLSHPDRKKYDLSSLETTLLGASTVPPDLLEKMKSELKLKRILVGYGMTETSLLASMTVPSDAHRSFKHGFESIGRPIGFLESKIIDPKTNQIVPLNTDGELCLRGFNILRHYWEDPKKTQDSIDKHGWFKTGDVCEMDKDGFLYFKSRSKDVIIRGGTNIYPAEVEAFLRTHPDIIDVCVFGIPDERFGEEIATWVKLKPNKELTLNELKNFCHDKIANFKVPKYLKVVDSFPLNQTGKVVRQKVIQETVAELKGQKL